MGVVIAFILGVYVGGALVQYAAMERHRITQPCQMTNRELLSYVLQWPFDVAIEICDIIHERLQKGDR